MTPKEHADAVAEFLKFQNIKPGRWGERREWDRMIHPESCAICGRPWSDFPECAEPRAASESLDLFTPPPLDLFTPPPKQRWVFEQEGSLNFMILEADICRKELLLEIECVAR